MVIKGKVHETKCTFCHHSSLCVFGYRYRHRHGHQRLGQLYVRPDRTGAHEVTVEKQGFSRITRQNVTVIVAQSTRVDAAMQVGTMTQQVNVSEAPPQIRECPEFR